MGFEIALQLHALGICQTFEQGGFDKFAQGIESSLARLQAARQQGILGSLQGAISILKAVAGGYHFIQTIGRQQVFQPRLACDVRQQQTASLLLQRMVNLTEDLHAGRIPLTNPPAIEDDELRLVMMRLDQSTQTIRCTKENRPFELDDMDSAPHRLQLTLHELWPHLERTPVLAGVDLAHESPRHAPQE